jgi:hypothetical protein
MHRSLSAQTARERKYACSVQRRSITSIIKTLQDLESSQAKEQRFFPEESPELALSISVRLQLPSSAQELLLLCLSQATDKIESKKPTQSELAFFDASTLINLVLGYFFLIFAGISISLITASMLFKEHKYMFETAPIFERSMSRYFLSELFSIV